MKRLAFLTGLFVAALGVLATGAGPGMATQARAAELVYFNSPACGVCERWDEEVGAIYPKTDEARRMPLRSHNIHDDKPADLAFVTGVAFTPTFVMVEDGREVGRIVGYISDYFFWEQVAGLIKKSDAAKNPLATACSQPAAGELSAPC